MKELQKYTVVSGEFCLEKLADSDGEFYRVSEADAAISERDQALEDRENTILHLREELSCAGITTEYQHKEIQRLKRDHAEEIERLKAEHELTVKRIQNAARTGMDAAHAISSHNLERARKLHNESKPEAIESERRANAILTEENERLRKQAERYEKLRNKYMFTFQWPSNRDLAEFDAMVDQLPASGGASVDEQS